MLRKTTSANDPQLPVAQLALVAQIPAPAESDTVAKPPRRARRARADAATPAPVPVKVEIDLAQKNAKDALTKAFPRPTSELMLTPTEATIAAAVEYMNARDAASIAEGAKERAANVIRYAIGTDLGIEGDGWKATWKEERGDLDVGALLKHLNVSESLIEQFRRPSKRVLRIVEVASAATPARAANE